MMLETTVLLDGLGLPEVTVLSFGILFTNLINSLPPVFTLCFLVSCPLSLTTAKAKLEM
jgi:hypothetical protein